MLELMKIVGLSAALSAGIVTASDMPPQPAPEAVGKLYTDRLPEGGPSPARFSRASVEAERSSEDAGTVREGKGNLLGQASGDCRSQAWPHVAPECLRAEGGPARGAVRMITVEQRQGPNTSALVRVPVSDMARH